jgi:Flp pilus assembly protein TadD
LSATIARARYDARAARPSALAMLLVALVAAAPYLASIGYGFVYDDGPIIANNPALHAPSGMLTAWRVAYWPAEWGRAGLFRPVVQFIYALLWNTSGGSPWLFHSYAVVLYAACAVAVLLVLARALPTRAAILGALIFAADPLHVESVANLAGSAEVVAALASIACVMVIVRALDERDGAIGWSAAIGSAAWLAVALGAKESAATVPALVALCAWGWRRPGEVTPIRAKAVLARGWRVWTSYAIVLALMIVARRAVLGGFSPPSTALAVGLDGETMAERWWTMTAAWPLVAHLLLLPTRLSMHYGPTTVIPHHAATAIAIAAIVTVAAMIGVAWEIAKRGDRRPLVAIGWVVLAYLAASNILVPTGQLLAERTLFFSSMGVVMLAGWALTQIERASITEQRAAMGISVALVLLGVFGTVVRVPVWSSEERLFTSGIQFDPAAFYPYQMLARAAGRRGDNARGLALLGDAYDRYPAGESLALEYAQHLRTTERGEDALAVLHAASIAHPMSQAVRLAYLDALLERRGPDSVITSIGIQRAPDPAGALRYVLLAHAYGKLDRPDSVTAVYARAVAEDGNDPGLRFAYASALHLSHREADAQRELDSAAASGAMPPAVHYSLQTRISLARGDSAGARRALARARAAAPGDTSLATLDSTLAARSR